ncbi:MAG: molybdopterin molybdotransferase MoeA [Saprospiraceae bacterium]
MITSQEALDIIVSKKGNYGIEEVPVKESLGRVLKEDLFTDRDLPPYDRITMDGIGINFAAFEKGQRSFLIEGVAAAGSPQAILKGVNNCLEVMTGASMPLNVDTVIRYEDLDIKDGNATLLIDAIKKGKNIHRKGEDRLQGALVVSANTVITPAEIGMACTIGKTKLKVAQLPKALIISTGDELVEIGEMPLPHQVRKSNVYQIQAILKKHQIESDTLHLVDDLEEIKLQLTEILTAYDVVVLSGGVSKGKFDFLPQALEELGVEKLFHKVKQRPGKPFWFGKSNNTLGTIVFALPGNPVSSFLCTTRYFLPWLNASLGLPTPTYPTAKLTENYFFKPDLTYYLQVKVSYDDKGRIWATPLTGNGSGDFANLVHADGFLTLSRGKNSFRKGSVHSLIFYK